MLPRHPDLQYDVQRLHHATLIAEAGLHHLRRTAPSAPRWNLPALRPFIVRAAQWLLVARPSTTPTYQPVTQVYQRLLHTQQRR